MAGGILLFHWQHVYDPASILGSSMLEIPMALRWITVGIEYHHIHHLRIRMPGYKLQECHEQAPSEFWSDVVVMGRKEMWDSLFMQVWDEDKGTYSTFAEVEREAKKL